jgi:hypothetical protein
VAYAFQIAVRADRNGASIGQANYRFIFS